MFALFGIAWGKGDLANNLANFELANQILVGEPKFNLANTNEYFTKMDTCPRGDYVIRIQ